MLPPASSFFRKEFPKLSRSSRGWRRTACPFHGGTNPTALSVNEQTGGFFCFNCGAKGGDLVAFVMQRYGMSFQDAAKELGAWDATNTVSAGEIRRIQREREEERRAESARIEQERQERVGACNALHALEKTYRFANRRLSQISQGARERYRGEQEMAWWLLADLVPRIREADINYRNIAGLELA